MLDKQTIENTLEAIKRTADYEYFFSKIEIPDWILPLREAGFFFKPPKVQEEGRYLKHPSWPESSYLLRMAAKAPEIVCETILKVSKTDNERVHQDYVEAACKMPPNYALKIAKKELEWIKSHDHFYFLYPKTIGALISHLAKNGQQGVAEALTISILDITVIDREYGKPGDEWYGKTTEIVSKFSTWEYEQIIEKNIPNLIATGGIHSFEKLCQLLIKALTLRSDLDQSINDYSWIWRPTIEEHEQNVRGQGDIKSILVDAIRDASLQLVIKDNSNLTAIINYLESQQILVMKRISLYLLSRFSSIQPQFVAERLKDHELFNNSAFRHEYALLARAGFGILLPEQQAVILSWIENGPDIEYFKTNVLAKIGRMPSDQEEATYIKNWQRDRLEQFKDHLNSLWKKRYDSLVAELGEPEHQDFTSWSTSWVGPTSPKTSDELGQMTIEEIVNFLSEWVPPAGPMDHSPEGLSRALAAAISANPTRFTKNAYLFKKLDPTYVRAVFDGLREISNSTADIQWGSILDLAEWVVSQPREIQGRKSEYSDLDPGWVWTRKSICSLISNSLGDVCGAISFEYRAQVWKVLLPLTEDLDPSEEKYGEGHMNPSLLSINSVRGEAMHSVIKYGLWIVRHTVDKEPSTFKLMPEVKDVLDKHLDIDVDASLAIRSVYAQWFPWLNLIDTIWAVEAREKIFSSDIPDYWDAAWTTYVTFCHPYDDVLLVLKDQYAFAIQKIGKPSKIGSDIHDADLRLSEHLMIYFLRGKLDMEDSLIQSFYTYATSTIKVHALEFLGRSLKDSPQDISVDTKGRLVSFWEWRYNQSEVIKNFDELVGFSWWFSCGKMDVDWSISELKNLLDQKVKLDDLDFVAEELVRLISVKPSDVLECLDLMINYLNTTEIYFSWDNEAKQILVEAMNNQDGSIRADATAIIHKLGSKGYFQFRSLLQND